MTNFGSFMNDDLELLLTQNEDNIRSLVVNLILNTTIKDDIFKYNLDKNIIFLNNGAFGLALLSIIKLSNKLMRYIEKNPLKYFDRELLPSIAYSTIKIAKYINSDIKNTILIPNSTYGINSVLNNYVFENNDTIIYFDYLYGSTKKNIEYIKQQNIKKQITINIVTIPVIFTNDKYGKIKKKNILSSLKNIICSNKNIKMIILEHISSILGITFPIKKIIKICKQHNILTLIDGAHVLGNIKLDIINIDPDIYITNTHKWFGNIKSCSILFVNDKYKNKFNSCIVSHGFYNGWASQYTWCGSNNYISYLTIPKLIHIWETYGFDNVIDKRNNLANLFLKTIKSKWNTKLIAKRKLFNNLYTIYLPDEINNKFLNNYSELQKIYINHNIEIPVKKINNRLCIRLSVNIYNTIDDINKLLEISNNLLHIRI